MRNVRIAVARTLATVGLGRLAVVRRELGCAVARVCTGRISRSHSLAAQAGVEVQGRPESGCYVFHARCSGPHEPRPE